MQEHDKQRINVCVCVCWVLGEEKEDSPRLWEACADFAACGCLVVQMACECMLYVYKHKSRTWMPSLENRGWWVKDL